MKPKRLPLGADATIERNESLGVASLLSLVERAKAIGSPRSLLYARIDWAKLQGVTAPTFGVPSPEVARETYSRAARREQRLRQMKKRGGSAAVARAILALA